MILEKQTFKRAFLGTLGVVLLFAPVFANVYADTASSTPSTTNNLNDKKILLQDQLNTLNKQISAYQGQIKQTQGQQASLKNEIFIYDTQIKSTELQIQVKQTEITDTNLQIDELENQIQKRQQEIADNKVLLKELLTQINETDSDSFLQVSLGEDNFSSFLDQVQYTQSVQDKVFEILQNIKKVKEKLLSQQDALKTQLAQLQDLKDQLSSTEDALSSQRSQKQSLLDKTRGLEKNYQTLLAASKKEEEDLQGEIANLDAEIRKQLGDRTIAPNKGSLAMPMKGVLTQGYGNTGFTALGYNFHNGLDIAAPAGAPIYAAANGEVVGTDSSNASYGNWVAIKHTLKTQDGERKIVTLYGHMRSFKVSVGDIVNVGDIIGYEGNTGNTTRILYGPERGYHLHFSVFDAEGFRITNGAYTKIYGPYKVPSGYTYNPSTFLK